MEILRIIILILSALAILLCLLQNDKNDGLLSLTVKSFSDKDEKNKLNTKLNIATAVVVGLLFIALIINMS